MTVYCPLVSSGYNEDSFVEQINYRMTAFINIDSVG